MKRRFYLTALITSPIIAMYGASPFYIFGKLPVQEFLKVCLGLTCHLLIIWAAHIICVRYFPKLRTLPRFAVTYLVSLVMQALFIAFAFGLKQDRPSVNDYLAYPILTSIAVNIIVMIIVNSIQISYKTIRIEQEMQEMKLAASEGQRRMLMQQLQPHFLFNSLSVLKSLINEDSQAAEDYSVKLSEFLRYSVQTHKADIVTLEEELRFTQNYLDLQRVRFDGAFTCDIDVLPRDMKARVPVFALQTLVENAFKHNHFTDKKPLRISIQSTGDTISVCNDIMTIVSPTQEGTGLDNLDKRYRLIFGTGIKVAQTEDRFCVTLPIDIV